MFARVGAYERVEAGAISLMAEGVWAIIGLRCRDLMPFVSGNAGVRRLETAGLKRSNPVAKRSMILYRLDPTERDQWDALCEHRGMTQTAVMTRLLGWFAKQDDLVQMSVMSLMTDEARQQLSKKLVARIANPGKGSSGPTI
jgi:hypothetical protein